MVPERNNNTEKGKGHKPYLEHSIDYAQRKEVRERVTSGKPTSDPPKDKNGNS